MSETPAIPAAAQSAVTRLGCSLDFVRLHWGPHTCLDGEPYVSRCLITDPSREGEFLALMAATPTTRAQAS